MRIREGRRQQSRREETNAKERRGEQRKRGLSPTGMSVNVSDSSSCSPGRGENVLERRREARVNERAREG